MLPSRTLRGTLKNYNYKIDTNILNDCTKLERGMVEITVLHCKCRFGTMKMLVRTPWNLNLHPIMDQTQMKMIDVGYNVKVKYWVSRTNVKVEY
jgi:hypothetical protein